MEEQPDGSVEIWQHIRRRRTSVGMIDAVRWLRPRVESTQTVVYVNSDGRSKDVTRTLFKRSKNLT